MNDELTGGPAMAPARDSHYVSTACQHTLHSRCRAHCKWCNANCRCDCHGDNAGGPLQDEVDVHVKNAILAGAARTDQRDIDDLVVAISALFNPDGTFAAGELNERGQNIAPALWELVSWHRGFENTDERDAMEALIARSSFGAPQVKAQRERTPETVTRAILQRLGYGPSADPDTNDETLRDLLATKGLPDDDQ